MIESYIRQCALAALLITSAACTSSAPAAGKGESVRLGDELAGQKRYRAAAGAYRLALDVDPSDKAVRDKLGKAFVLAGDPVRAADLLPDDLDVQLKAAALLLNQSRFADATARVKDLLRVHPDNANVLVLLGNALAHLPNSMWPLYTMADALIDKDTYEARRKDARPPVSSSDNAKAEETYRKATSLAPAMTETWLALANFLLVAGRPNEAEAPLLVAVEQQPLNLWAKHALGALYLYGHREAEALPYLRDAAGGLDDQSRSVRFMLADYYNATSRQAEARTMIDSMKPADDEEGEVSVRRAELDGRSGKPAEAVRTLDALLARKPTKASALLLKAQILFRMGNPDLRFARAAVAVDSGSSDARMLVGDALSASGDLDGALVEYREAAKLRPSAVPPKLAIVRVSLELGRAPEALLHAKDAVRIAPDDRDAALAHVEALIATPDYDAAAEALRPLQQRFPDVPAVAVQEGRLAAARGSDALARAAFTRALQLDADSIEALAGLVSLDKTQPSADTQKRVELAVEAHPRNPDVLLVAASLYAAMHDQARRESMLRRAFELDPANIAVGQTLASLMKELGRPNDAISVMRQVAGRRPQSVEVRTSLAFLLEDSGRPKEALPLYEQIVTEDSGAALVSYRLASLYLADPDKLSVALDLATAAKRGLPDDPAVSDLLGRVYTAKGLPSLGISALKEAVAAAPGNALYHYHLGDAYQKAGSLAQARTEYANALQIDDSFPGAEEAKRFAAARR